MIIFATLVGIAAVIFCAVVVYRVVKYKYEGLVNPIAKDNSDYMFSEIQKFKTRSILSEEN